MSRLLGTRWLLAGAIAVSLLISPWIAVAEDQMSSSAGCVLRAMAVDQEDWNARLVLHTVGPPASLGSRIEPGAVIVVALAGCSPGPELVEQSFTSGLIAGLRPAANGSNVAVVVETRQGFEYSVSSKHDRVDVTLRAAADTSALVRVLEPLPVPRGAPQAETKPALPPQAVETAAPADPLEYAPRRPDPPPPEPPAPQAAAQQPATQEPATQEPAAPAQATSARIVAGARLSVEQAPRYDPSYAAIAYPNGDPGWHRGSGVDLIVRAYRQLGVDLQQAIHEDIVQAAEAYGVRRPDTNIDHRRVRNLVTFLERHGQSLPTNADWRPGDVVIWAGERPKTYRVGIVSDRTRHSGRHLAIHHNQDTVPVEDDVLQAWPVTGHYRWLPAP